MKTIQGINPQEISSFVPKQKDFFWKSMQLNLKESLEVLDVRIIEAVVLDRMSVAMVLELAEDIRESGLVNDEFISSMEYASSHGETPRHNYLFGVLAYKLRYLAKDPDLRTRCVLDLGLASAELGMPNQALPLLLQARQYFLESKSINAVLACNRYLASVYSDLGKTDEAIQLLEENRRHFEKRGDLLELAYTNFTLANAYYKSNDYRTALGFFEQAKDTFTFAANDTRWLHRYIELSIHIAACNLNMAAVYDDIGMHDQATQLCEAAREIYSRKGYDSYDKTGIAKCDLTLATIYSRLNQPQKALELYQRARAVFEKEGFELKVALCNMNMAGKYDDYLDDQETSLRLYEQARSVYEKQGIQDMVRKIDLDIALVKKKIERKKSQTKDLPVAFRMKAEKLYDIPVVVTMSPELEAGMLDKYDKLVKEGASPKERALFLLYNTDPTNPVVVDKLIELCNSLLVELAQEPRLAWKVHYHLAQAYRHQASLFYYYNHDPLFDISLERAGVSLMTFADALSKRKREMFYRFMSERHFGLEEYTYAILDDEYLDSILDDDAELENLLAESVPGESFIIAGFHRFKEQKFEKLEKAFEHVSSAIKILDALRAVQISEHSKIGFMEDKYQVFRLAIDLCIDLEEYELVLVQVEQAKSRSLVEMLANTNVRVPSTLPQTLLEREKELMDYLKGNIEEVRKIKQTRTLLDRTKEFLSFSRFGRDKEQPTQTYRPTYDEVQRELEEIRSHFLELEPEYVSLRRGESLDLQRIQRVLKSQKKKAMIVEFYVGNVLLGLTEQQGDKLDYRLVTGERLLAFVWGNQSDKPSLRQIPLTTEDLHDLVDEASYEIRQQETGVALTELGKQLLSPLQELTQGYELLIIIPYGPLHNIPFHALPFRGRALIDYFEISYTPSITVLHHCQNKLSAATRACLVLGYDETQRNRINYIEEEAIEVANLFGTQAWLKESAIKQTLIDHSKGKQFIHLACHGEFSSPRPMESSIYLANGERLSASEIFSLEISADLVTLSACETGLSKVITGDELMGLTRSLLYAGARSVIVSLWRVESASTKELMHRFYELLLNGMSKSAALRKAQLEIRNKYQYPFHWSPFILIGDWQ